MILPRSDFADMLGKLSLYARSTWAAPAPSVARAALVGARPEGGRPAGVLPPEIAQQAPDLIPIQRANKARQINRS